MTQQRTGPATPARTARPHRSADARRHYAELIGALLAEGDTDAARECAALAVGQGVWRHPDQRPPHYLPSLEPQPVHDPSRFWFTAHLERNYPLMRAEIDAVTDPRSDGFLPVEEPLLDRGRWEQVTFYEAGHRFDDACARFPVTASVIDAIPEAAHAGTGVVTLSWLYPGTHVVPHCGGTNTRLRVHLGLRVPPGPVLRVGAERLSWGEGRAIVFDDSFEHEVWHDGEEPRVVLLMDVPHPDLGDPALERALAARTSFADRVMSFMTEHGIERVELEGDGVRLHAGRGTTGLVLRHLREVGSTSVSLRDGKLEYR